mgnify:CR=1 FL=1
MGGIIVKYELQKLDEDTIDQLICLSKNGKRKTVVMEWK